MNYDVSKLLQVLQEADLPGYGGRCGEVAIAINDVFFHNKGEIIAAANKYLLEENKRFVGHFGVRFHGDVWDAEGVWENENVPQEFLARGMLDPDDPDYEFPSEEDAYAVLLLENLNAEEVRDLLPACLFLDGNPRDLLFEAMEKYEDA